MNNTLEIETIECIICNSHNLKPHFYLPNKFGNRFFKYYKCADCKSISIQPTPNNAELNKMYGIEDHNYLKDLENITYEFKYPKYSYKWHQLNFLKIHISLLQGKNLLDYACGNGYYIAYANKLGLKASGIEFNEAFAKILRKKSGLDIFSVEELKNTGQKFDIIHFGHVLEHLPKPEESFKEICQFAHENTLFIFDGPLENNSCLSRNIIDLGVKLKKKLSNKKYNEYEPQHLSFTNYSSQLKFFEKIGLKQIKYIAAEQHWPLPAKLVPHSPGSILKYFLAQTSIHISNIVPKYGNVFHYIGQFKT